MGSGVAGVEEDFASIALRMSSSLRRVFLKALFSLRVR